MPTASDFPNIRVFLMEEEPSPINPLGAKGAGEGGIIPRRRRDLECGGLRAASFKPDLRELPLSPTRVWEMAQKWN